MYKIDFYLLLTSIFIFSINGSLAAQNCFGGTIETEDNETIVYVCINDGDEDEIEFDSDDESDDADYVLVITDLNDEILLITDDDEVDFEDSGVGDCKVYGLSFTGDLTAEVGAVLTQTTLSTDCADLTTNFVLVIRREVEETEVHGCIGMGKVQPLSRGHGPFFATTKCVQDQ